MKAYDPLFDVAHKTVDEVLGEGEYAWLNHNNPGIPAELRQKLEASMPTLKGYAENAVCPRCQTYTRQQIIRRGVRECDCGHRFHLRDTDRIQHGRLIHAKKDAK